MQRRTYIYTSDSACTVTHHLAVYNRPPLQLQWQFITEPEKQRSLQVFFFLGGEFMILMQISCPCCVALVSHAVHAVGLDGLNSLCGRGSIYDRLVSFTIYTLVSLDQNEL